MHWLAFAASLVAAFCYLFLWYAADGWLQQRGTPVQRWVGSVLLIVAMAIPLGELMPEQSYSVQRGAAGGLILSAGLGSLLVRRIGRRHAK